MPFGHVASPEIKNSPTVFALTLSAFFIGGTEDRHLFPNFLGTAKEEAFGGGGQGEVGEMGGFGRSGTLFLACSQLGQGKRKDLMSENLWCHLNLMVSVRNRDPYFPSHEGVMEALFALFSNT